MTTTSYPINGSNQVYWVFKTDALGYELPELHTSDSGYISTKLISLVSDRTKPTTDFVIAVHGWATKQKDNEALDIFDEIFAGLMKDYKDFPSEATVPNFLLIGVHWPSAVGAGRADELVDDEASFEDNMLRMKLLCENLLKTDPPAEKRMRDLLSVLNTAADKGSSGLLQSMLDRKVEKVHQKLIDPYADDSDNEFEIEAALKAEAISESRELKITPDARGRFYNFSKFIISNVFRRLEKLLFGQFVQRAEHVGENGLHTLLALMQEYSPETRINLVGHSLGTVAVSRALVGGANKSYLLRKKVHSVTMLQGEKV